MESITIYLRQDPFKETIYQAKYSILFNLGQMVGALNLLHLVGWLLTAFWTYRLYNAALIKQLYKVKHTSAGRDIDHQGPSK